MASIIDELEEQAQELIEFGNSKEQHEGYGIQRATNELRKYYYGFNIIMEYFDSISDEEKPILHKKLSKLGL
jgi:thiamine pyrophosphokinase